MSTETSQNSVNARPKWVLASSPAKHSICLVKICSLTFSRTVSIYPSVVNLTFVKR